MNEDNHCKHYIVAHKWIFFVIFRKEDEEYQNNAGDE